MLESQPATSPGTTFGYMVITGLVLLDTGLFFLLVRGPLSLFSVLWGLMLLASLPLLAILAYWTICLRSARYHVVENALLIEWGGLHQVVPLAAIQSLQWGHEVTAVSASSRQTVTQFRGFRWPGLMVGQGRIREQDAFFFATRPLGQQLLLQTDTAVYAISPVDLHNFKDCLEALRTADLDAVVNLPDSNLGFLQWRFWDEWPAQLLLMASGLLNLALFGYLTAVYSHLPAQIPLHFNRWGEVDRLATPGRLFVLPIIGLTAWIVNGIGGWFFYQQEQTTPAYLLWGTAVIVQLAIWGAVLGLLAHN